jgi:hypothetical protein
MMLFWQKSGGKPTFLTCETFQPAWYFSLESFSMKNQNSIPISSWSGSNFLCSSHANQQSLRPY